MKSPGVIYRKYRQLRRKLLYDTIQEAKRCSHSNCVYGKVVEVTTNGVTHKIPICLYSKNLDTCSNPLECNAFINKNIKEKVEEKLLNELKDPNIRANKYPELNLLDWVLDKTLEEAKKEPNLIVKVAVYLIGLLENLIKITEKDQKVLMDK